MDPESLMQGRSVRRSSLLTDICCLIFAIGFLIYSIFVYKNVDIITIGIVGLIIAFVGLNIYQRYAWKTRVRNHILRYKDTRVPLINLMKELNLPFLDLMYFVEELQKKKYPIEVNERTGELLIGDVPIRKSYLIGKAKPIPRIESRFEAPKSPESASSSKRVCPHCNAPVSSEFQFCDHCGKQITPEKDEEK